MRVSGVAKYVPSVEDWRRDHVALYESTGGTSCGIPRANRLPVIIATQAGNKTATARKAAKRTGDEGGCVRAASHDAARENAVSVHDLRQSSMRA
jgi:hypothetical protein